MADQEFLASFAVEIDESGVEKLQKALTQNRELADELASAFDAAREAVGDFFKQLSASTLPTGELSPYQRLMDLSECGFSFELDLDTSDAEEQLDTFLQQARDLFEETRLPLGADAAPALSAGNEILQQLQKLFSSSALPLGADAQEVLSAGQSALAELLRSFSSTLLPLDADTSAVNSSGQTVLRQLQDLFSASALPLDADPAKALSARDTLRAALNQKEEGNARSGRETASRADALSGLPDLLASAPAAAAPVVTQTANNSVQAPVSINVTAAGTDPEAVGKSVYDVTEQYLLRTLRGAL